MDTHTNIHILNLTLGTENAQHKKPHMLHFDRDKEAKRTDFPESRYLCKAANGSTIHMISVEEVVYWWKDIVQNIPDGRVTSTRTITNQKHVQD
ncbi:hypothetical protein TNCV_446311 [Trichonephila clavipes]|nr:hypothetical protein TNCV_446311 [Trichonephila clavipes]